MKVRILCYLPAIDGHLLDNGIDWWSRLFNLKAPKELRCSHTEVWTPDELGRFEHDNQAMGHIGSCRTSTMRKPYDGVCRRSASSVLRHPNRWNYFNIDIDDRVYQSFISDMEAKVANNLGYDKWTIASYFWYKRLGNPYKYICSEFVHLSILPFVADQGRLFRNLLQLNCPSPIRFAYALHRSGLDLYSLETGQCILKGQI
jgi:hypothetical protein